MYKKYYGLSRKPFDLSPDPTIVFGSETHREALATLRYGVRDSTGFLLLTGEAGTGKTTLLQVLCNSIGENIHLCMISNPTINREEFYYYLCEKLGLGSYDGNKAKFVLRFTEFLKDCYKRGEKVVLIIDEAHVVPIDVLEEIRLLSNQDFQTSGIMSIFLVGQPELLERLGDERLLSLRQRISSSFHMKNFSQEETGRYVIFRLMKAGAAMNFFTNKALELIHEFSNGTPRLINVVCDRAMLMGFAESSPALNAPIIQKSIQEVHIPGTPEANINPEADIKSEQRPFFEKGRVAYRFVQPVFWLFLPVLVGELYYAFSQPHWIGHKTIKSINELLLTKGVMFWELFLRH